MSQSDEKVLFENIKKGHLQSFETVFHQYYGMLCSFAENYTKNPDSAEEIVQDIFVRFWEKREQLNIEFSLKNYLLRSVKNQCLNYIKHEKIQQKHILSTNAKHESNDSFEDNFLGIELAEKIEESISSLPEKRREIFRLSREDGLKYHEIANKMNISVKTVETQMSLAIKYLRTKLIDFLSILLILLHFFR